MRIIGLLLAGSLSIVACNPFTFWGNALAQRDVADKATTRFHTMLDSADYETIWSQSDSAFQQSAPEKDAIALFRMVNRRFGRMEGTTLVTWNVNVTTSYGTVVRLVYRTAYTADSATETFSWRMHDGQPALLSYNINSPLLLRAMVDEKN